MRREMVRQGLDILVGIGTSSSYCMPAFGAELGDEAVGLFASDKPDSDALNVRGLTPSGRALLERARRGVRGPVRRADERRRARRLLGRVGAAARGAAGGRRPLAGRGRRSRERERSCRRGRCPNGSGLRFGEPGSVTAGANLLASSVIWQWQAPGSYAVVAPDRYATSETLLLDPLP